MTFNPGHDAEFWKAVDTPSFNAPAQLIEAARDKSTKLNVDDRRRRCHPDLLQCSSISRQRKDPRRRYRDRPRRAHPDTHHCRTAARGQRRKATADRQRLLRGADRQYRAAATERHAKDKKRTLRYWAVVHAPDADNDNRNNHLHVVFYDRAADKMLDLLQAKCNGTSQLSSRSHNTVIPVPTALTNNPAVGSQQQLPGRFSRGPTSRSSSTPRLRRPASNGASIHGPTPTSASR